MSIVKHSFGNTQMPLSVEIENCICSYSASFHQSLAPGFVGEALWMGPTAHLHPRNTTQLSSRCGGTEWDVHHA